MILAWGSVVVALTSNSVVSTGTVTLYSKVSLLKLGLNEPFVTVNSSKVAILDFSLVTAKIWFLIVPSSAVTVIITSFIVVVTKGVFVNDTVAFLSRLVIGSFTSTLKLLLFASVILLGTVTSYFLDEVL